MANVPLNLTIDLTGKRIVRENNPAVSLRKFSFSEGFTYTGTISLLEDCEAVDSDLISAVTIEIGNYVNDVALVRHDGNTATYTLSFHGDLLRQYLYGSAEKEAVFTVVLTVSGKGYYIDSVPVSLFANPDDNTGNPSGPGGDDIELYRVLLYARPAGTNVLASGVHSVGSQNINLPGWLNTTGSDPAGYAFKYNIAQDSQLVELFPPTSDKLPFAHLEINGMAVGSASVLVTLNGIYWKDNSQGYAPWPLDYVNAGNPGSDIHSLELVLDFIR